MEVVSKGMTISSSGIVVRQFVPTRIEREVLAHVFALVCGQRNQKDTAAMMWLRNRRPGKRTINGQPSRGTETRVHEIIRVLSPSTTTIRIAIYARVSSDRQAQEQTIESQVADLRSKSPGWTHTR